MKEFETILPLGCVCLFSLHAGHLLFDPLVSLPAPLHPPSCLRRLTYMDCIRGTPSSWLPIEFNQGRALAEDENKGREYPGIIYSPWLPFWDITLGYFCCSSKCHCSSLKGLFCKSWKFRTWISPLISSALVMGATPLLTPGYSNVPCASPHFHKESLCK